MPVGAGSVGRLHFTVECSVNMERYTRGVRMYAFRCPPPEVPGCRHPSPFLHPLLMASELGQRIRDARQQQGLGLRDFAKAIGKSPGFVTQLECDEGVPSVAEDTLRSVASVLRLEADELLVLARRTPSDVVPESSLEVALYRRVKGLSRAEQEEMRRYMDQQFGTGPGR